MRAEVLQTPVGKVNFIDLKPENHAPNSPTYIFPSGWGGSFLPMAEKFAEIADETKSRMIITYTELDDGNNNLNAGPNYARELSGSAFALVNLIEAARINNPVPVGYSKAGPVVTFAGMMTRDPVAGIVLVNSASLIGRDSAAELMGRYAIGAIKTTTNPDYPDLKMSFRDASQNIWQYIRQNGLRAYREIQEMSVTPLHEILPALRSRGTPIGVLSAKGDLVFPPSRMRQVLFSKGRSIVDDYEELDGDHGVFVTKPRQVLSKVISTSQRIIRAG